MSATGKPKVLRNSLRQSLLSPELLARASRSREPIAISLDSRGTTTGMSATGKPKVLRNSLRQSLLSPELLARASH